MKLVCGNWVCILGFISGQNHKWLKFAIPIKYATFPPLHFNIKFTSNVPKRYSFLGNCSKFVQKYFKIVLMLTASGKNSTLKMCDFSCILSLFQPQWVRRGGVAEENLPQLNLDSRPWPTTKRVYKWLSYHQLHSLREWGTGKIKMKIDIC